MHSQTISGRQSEKHTPVGAYHALMCSLCAANYASKMCPAPPQARPQLIPAAAFAQCRGGPTATAHYAFALFASYTN